MIKYKFELTKEEIKIYEKWITEQIKKYDNLSSFEHYEMGNRFSICFTPSAIGIIATSIDHHLKEKKILSLYDYTLA